MSLPIFALQDDFAQTIAQSPILVVHAPTGSGKSTQLPLWLQQQVQGPVAIVEPRRIACRALASYLSQQRGEEVGRSIGYRVRFESAISKDTQIEFVTPGVALRLLQDPQSSRYRAWMLDEFHERSWELDLLLACLRHRHQQTPYPLVLTSATLETDALCEQLGAQLLRAEGRSYPVDIQYLQDAAQPTTRDIEQRATEAIQKILQKEKKKEGDILFFLPGKAEIERCRQALRLLAQQHQLQLVPLHGTLPSKQLTQALAPQANQRRLYLSTNVAETSLTLPQVTTVLDSGLARMRIHRGGQSALSIVPIALSQMDQRAGRAGRTAPGQCFRMWEDRYQPDPALKPEIERIEVDDLLLQAAALDLKTQHAQDAPWLTPPPDFAHQRAKQRLQEVGALDPSGQITSLGHELARWPIPAFEAYLLLGAPKELLPTLADLIALLQQSRSDLLLPLHLFHGEKRDDLLLARRELFGLYNNEVYTQLACLRHGHPQKHGLHDQTLQQARAIAAQLRARLQLPAQAPEKDDTSFPSPEALARWLLQRAPQLGFVLRERALKPQRNTRHQPTTQPWANGEIEAQWEPFQPWDEDAYTPPRAGVILQTAWIAQKDLRIAAKARMLLPCSPRTLAACGLGEITTAAPKIVRSPKGDIEIVAQLQQELAGITLRSEEAALEGHALREAATMLASQDRLWKGLWEQLLDRLYLIQLAQDFPDYAGQSTTTLEETTPEAWLSRRLENLGLEQSEELSLLDEQDLLPDPTSHTGLDPFTLQELADDFPRRWIDQGRTYLCTVRARSRRVTLEPFDAAAKKAPDPPAQRLPRFRGFHVDFRKASRVLTLRGTPQR
ncbi:MAG: ATP-dependent RNA helicase [Myxococcales bacterium]|nr:ATP-dependent RNA helicase [Myxococcales bacterium]